MSLKIEIELTDGYKLRVYQDGCMCCNNTRYMLVDEEDDESAAWGGDYDVDALECLLRELVFKISGINV